MLLPMGMMAQGYHFVNHANGLEYICKDGDTEDDDHLFIWVGSDDMTVLVDGQSVSSGRYIEQSSLRPQLRRDYNEDQGEFYKSRLESIKTIASVYNSPNTFKGIEYFRNLESLSLNSKGATSVDLDLSQNTELKTLTFNQTEIKLRTLNISNTQLTSLTIPSGSQTTLTNLYVGNSKITSLNLGPCSNLRVLDADNIAFISNSALTLPTTTNKLEELSLEGVMGLNSVNVGIYSALATLHVNGSSIAQLTLPTATGILKHLNLSNNTNLGNYYNHANPLDVSMYPRLVAVADGHSNTGGALIYDNSNLSVYLGSDGNLKIYPEGAEFITHTCTPEEAEYAYMDYSGHPNLIGLVLTGAQGVRLPANRTTFVLDLTGSPNIAEVDFNNSASTLTSLNAVNVKKIDVSACSELQELIYTGPASENLVLATASGSYPDLTTLVLTKSSVKTLDLKGGGTSATCIAPNLQNFRAFYSALEEIDLSNHAQLSTLSLLPPKEGHDESVEAYGINAFNEGNKLKTLKIANCTNLTGEVALNFVGSNWYYYNALEYIDASGCTGITQFQCPNNLLEHLDLSNCSSLELIDITQGRLTGNGDIDLSGCNNLSVFNASRNRWESMDFLLKPSSGRTAAAIGNLTSIRVNGGSYTLAKDNVRYVREYNDEPMFYTSRLTELDLSRLVNGTFKELHCEDNLIQSLDLSAIGPGMTTLKCANNMMLTLNLNSLNTETLEEDSRWSPQVAYLNAEAVKGDDGTDSTEGRHDWVALPLPGNDGYTHCLDNNLALYANLWDYFNGGTIIAQEASPWMCLVSETDDIATYEGEVSKFKGNYLHHDGHEGYHLFLHSQSDIQSQWGTMRDQDLYGNLLTYRYNTGYNRVLGTNPINGKENDTPSDIKKTASNNLDPHIEIRAHIWPYIINLHPLTKNAESQAADEELNYYSSTLFLDYDAVIPEGVSVYYATGITNRNAIENGGTSTTRNQVIMTIYGGDDSENKILPAFTPVYVRSKSSRQAGLYAFNPVWEFDIKGWENLRSLPGHDEDLHVLHGVRPTDQRTVKPEYVAALAAAKEKKKTMPKNLLTGIRGQKYNVTDMTAENFNVYERNDTTLESGARTCLTLSLQTQKLNTQVIGFWPFNGTVIPAHRCVILEADYNEAVAKAEAKGETIDSTGDAKGGSFYFIDEGFDATGIDDLNENSLTTTQAGWYTLQGIRLNSQPQKQGIYIHNGKKITIK